MEISKGLAVPSCNKELYSHEILMILEAKCQCGYPLPLGFELLTGQRDFICPKCGRDNTPIWGYDDDDDEGDFMKSSELVEKIESFCKENGLVKPAIELTPQWISPTGKKEDAVYDWTLIRLQTNIKLE